MNYIPVFNFFFHIRILITFSKKKNEFFSGPDSFLLSDLTSLLMRLELENNNTMTKKLDLKERWREIGNLYDGILDNSMTINMFYDVHSLLGCLYGDKQ